MKNPPDDIRGIFCLFVFFPAQQPMEIPNAEHEQDNEQKIYDDF